MGWRIGSKWMQMAQGWMVVDTEMPPFISEAHIPPNWWKCFLPVAQQFVPF